MKTIIITDSASDIAPDLYENVRVLPMTITFGDREYKDGVNLSHRRFYELLVESEELPVTSQISPYEFGEAMEEALKTADAVLVITMSSKLSGTYQSAVLAASEYPGKVFPVDSENVTVGEHMLVEYANRLLHMGKTPEEVVKELDSIKKRIRVVGLLDTLEYLKKGGRISKAAAFAGNVLSIRPVVTVKDGAVEILGKARGSKQANNLIVEAIHNSGGVDFDMPYFLGYTGLNDDLLQKYIRDNATLWEEKTDYLPISTVGGTIGTHVGPGAIVVAWIGLEQ